MGLCENPKIAALYKGKDGKYKTNLFLYHGETKNELTEYFTKEGGKIPKELLLHPNEWQPKKGRTYEKIYLIPCGKCYSCLIKKRKDWVNRLEIETINELKENKKAYFITLTYDEQNLPNQPNKKEIQKFLKRLRFNTNEKLRYYLVAERGEIKNRIHYHAIIWTKSNVKNMEEQIKKAWGMGRTETLLANEKMIAYTAGYVNKKLVEKREDEFTLMSTKPAIGTLTEIQEKKVLENSGYITLNGGNRTTLPKTLKNKLIDGDEMKKAIFQEFYKGSTNAFYNEWIDYKKKNPSTSYDAFLELKKNESKTRRCKGTLKAGVGKL